MRKCDSVKKKKYEQNLKDIYTYFFVEMNIKNLC